MNGRGKQLWRQTSAEKMLVVVRTLLPGDHYRTRPWTAEKLMWAPRTAVTEQSGNEDHGQQSPNQDHGQ